jgi:hypothetical protein
LFATCAPLLTWGRIVAQARAPVLRQKAQRSVVYSRKWPRPVAYLFLRWSTLALATQQRHNTTTGTAASRPEAQGRARDTVNLAVSTATCQHVETWAKRDQYHRLACIVPRGMDLEGFFKSPDMFAPAMIPVQPARRRATQNSGGWGKDQSEQGWVGRLFSPQQRRGKPRAAVHPPREVLQPDHWRNWRNISKGACRRRCRNGARQHGEPVSMELPKRQLDTASNVCHFLQSPRIGANHCRGHRGRPHPGCEHVKVSLPRMQSSNRRKYAWSTRNSVVGVLVPLSARQSSVCVAAKQRVRRGKAARASRQSSACVAAKQHVRHGKAACVTAKQRVCHRKATCVAAKQRASRQSNVRHGKAACVTGR